MTFNKMVPVSAPIAPPKLKKPCAEDIKLTLSFFSISETKVFIAISVSPEKEPTRNSAIQSRV